MVELAADLVFVLRLLKVPLLGGVVLDDPLERKDLLGPGILNLPDGTSGAFAKVLENLETGSLKTVLTAGHCITALRKY
jgi:hypothetical protein